MSGKTSAALLQNKFLQSDLEKKEAVPPVTHKLSLNKSTPPVPVPLPSPLLPQTAPVLPEENPTSAPGEDAKKPRSWSALKDDKTKAPIFLGRSMSSFEKPKEAAPTASAAPKFGMHGRSSSNSSSTITTTTTTTTSSTNIKPSLPTTTSNPIKGEPVKADVVKGGGTLEVKNPGHGLSHGPEETSPAPSSEVKVEPKKPSFVVKPMKIVR
jgi:hypothetical protein